MTYTTLASIVKYPFASALAEKGHGKFGFFSTEADIFCRIADDLGIIRKSPTAVLPSMRAIRLCIL